MPGHISDKFHHASRIPHAPASERLMRHNEKIMNLWLKRVNKEVKAAAYQNTFALRNSLPEYLFHLAEALSSAIDLTEDQKKHARDESLRLGKKHGEERAGSLNYTMDQLILEYHILRQVICNVLEEEMPLTPFEREIITTSVEQAVSDAASQFSDTLKDIQKHLSQTLAHDLRNPITFAKASAQLILRRPEDSDNCLKMATQICNYMDRLDKMIRDLLDVSKLRAGQQLSLKFNDCDLDWVVKTAANELNFVHNGRFIVSSKGMCLGHWSEDGLRRVIDNLTNNALKYGSKDAPITLTLDQNKTTAILSVHNEGEPIFYKDKDKDKDKEVLFQQFRRLKSAESKLGWGLGLSMVKGMVEAHKGSIEVESEKDKGTTFIIRIPKDSRGKNL